MNIKRVAATGAVTIGLAASGIVFSQAWSDPATPGPVPTSSSTSSLDAAVAKAAAKAGLVTMCERGQLDSDAESTYEATAAAHPDLAGDIGPDCRIATVTP
jgi:hypothetical protein